MPVVSRTRLLVLALVIAASPASPASQASSAQGQGRALAIEDYYRIRVVGAPQLSPDGRWVAFTVASRIEATNGDSSEVWLAAADGSTRARRVSAPSTHAVLPQWSADGRLGFAAGGRRWSVNPATPDSIVETGGVVQSGRVALAGRLFESPDGKHAAVIRDVPLPRHDRVYKSDFERRHEERFRGVQFDWLDFQRDGQPFPVPNRVDPVVTPPQEIFVSDNGSPNAGTARQITRLGLRPSALDWSRDGRAIVFTADSSYRDERRYGSDEIYMATVDGDVRKLTSNRSYDYAAPRFSPDGKWILYTRQLSTDAIIAQRLNHGGATDLAVMPVSGGAEKLLTADWDYLPANASWSADGKYVYFSGGVGGATHLFRASASTGRVEQVTQGDRRITGISFDRAFTRMAYTVGVTDAPAEVYVADIDGSNERRISHANDALLREVRFSKTERLGFKSQDGTDVEGFLLYPYGYQTNAGSYPLIVSSHGGPHSADGYAFDFKNQLFAANGYFVLQVNFRSSTGYGEKFLWGTWGAWGTRDGEDVMAGVDYVIQRVHIDPRRVAAIGHSYGGFMTNWLITQYPDRFAAAASGAGIVNWLSDYGTADVARTKETEFYGTPWDDRAREIMLKQSPLIYANRVKTPTLFINGELDQRVPYSEAEQMFVALKKNGVPTKMIQYAGMPHGITGHWNVVHRMLNELRWFDTYLK